MALWQTKARFVSALLFKILALLFIGEGLLCNFAFSQSEKALVVKNIQISGNTIFTDVELLNLIPRKINSPQDLDLIQKRINDHYIQNGYIGSGSLIPPQELGDGSLEIVVVESILDSIEIKGADGLKEKFIKSQLPPEGKPLNVNAIIRALSGLEKNALVGNISGEVVSKGPGKNALLIDLKENNPAGVSLDFSDSFAPSIGGFGGTAQFVHNNLLGFQDRVTLSRSQSEGLESTALSYSVLVNKNLGRLNFRFSDANSEIVEDSVSNFDIQGDFRSLTFDFQQPILRTNREQLTLGVAFQHIDSETFILEDFSFAFVEGLDDGESSISTIQFLQNYSRRGSKTSLSFNSQFNLGVDIFDATVTDEGIDGLFWSWQGNGQYLLSLDKEQNVIANLRLQTQLSPDKLLPAEQISLGGTGTVRGYRRNLVVADNGVILGGEIAFALIKNNQWGNLSLVPFLDAGTVWNNDRDTTGSNFFLSSGIGWRYNLRNLLEVRLDYAIPLVEASGFGGTETVDNFNFAILVQPFNF